MDSNEFKICNDPQDYRTCKARLNSKLFVENKLLLNEWILIECTNDYFICKVFPIYSSFHSMENVFIDRSIHLKKTENQNNTNQFKIKKLHKHKKCSKIVLLDLMKHKGEQQFEEEDEYSKIEMIGLIISVGFYLYQRWKVLEIDDQKQIDSQDNFNFFIITKDTEIKLIRDFIQPQTEEDVEIIKQVGGLDKIIEEIEQVALYPIIYSEKFKTLSGEFPKGMLIIGNSGCGKTAVVDWICQKHKIECIRFRENERKNVGSNEKLLRKLFQEAEILSERKKPVFIFLKNIETLFPKRSDNIEESRVVAQLLTLMDGIEPMKSGIFVIATTSQPNSIDSALRRAGRFEKEINISVPNKFERLEIFKIHTQKMKLDDSVDLNLVSDLTVGYVGHDCLSLCRESALHAIKSRNVEVVIMDDFLFCLKKIVPSSIRSLSIEIPDTKWDDIGGLEDIKREFQENTVWPILHRESFERFKNEPNKGILLYGPPGNGKSTIVKALASNFKSTFIYLNSSNIYSSYFGESEFIIREAFKKSRSFTPSIIFIDEIDSIVGKRDFQSDSGNNTQKRILSTLLNEMDGVENIKDLLIVAASNRIDLIDQALLRPGRFGKLLHVGNPNLETRNKIILNYLKKFKLNFDVEELSSDMDGLSSAQVVSLCKEAVFSLMRKMIETNQDIPLVLERKDFQVTKKFNFK